MTRYWLTPELAESFLSEIEKKSASVECSLDLGLSKAGVRINDAGIALPDGSVISIEKLREMAEKRGCFLVEGGSVSPIEMTGDYFYKLIPTDEAPTIEISGIQMHRTTGTSPFKNAMKSAKSVVRRGDRVLDTCGGLGYTAISAARLGAKSVVSLDVDMSVREIARLNPWSADYFSHPVITLVEADAAEYVAAQPDGSLETIIHDPPRFSRAGHLYSGEFYRQCSRILAPRNGRIFHYTGDPYSRGKGRSFIEGVANRMRDAGFTLKIMPELQGIVAKKM